MNLNKLHIGMYITMHLLPPTCMQLHSHSIMKVLQVVAVLVTVPTLGHAIQTEYMYFVTPNENTPCPTLPCHALSLSGKHYTVLRIQYQTKFHAWGAKSKQIWGVVVQRCFQSLDTMCPIHMLQKSYA